MGHTDYYTTNMKLKIPRNCLVVSVDEDRDHLSILYEGETWYVRSADVYPMSDNLIGDDSV